MPTEEITFRLDIDADSYVRYYRGTAKNVYVQSDDGRTLQFPANILRPFVTRDGIQGRFKLNYDEKQKVAGILKIE